MADEDLELDVDGGEEAPKSKKKLFIIIGAVVFLIIAAVGGMFAMGLFSSDPEIDPSEESIAEEVDADEGDEERPRSKTKIKEEVPSEEALYWPLEPPFVMNFEGKSKAKYMQVQIVAMSRSQNSISILKKHMPAIRSELQFLLGSQKYVEMVTPEGKEQVREEILESMNELIKNNGGKGLDKIYFTSFVMQ